MGQSETTILIIIVTFFVAGLVKGVTGMGLPTVAMGILGGLLSPLTAAALLIVPSFVTNVWQLLTGPGFKPLLLRLWPMMLALFVGTLAGSSLLASGDTAHMTVVLGVTLVAYAAYTLFMRQRQISGQWHNRLSPPVGLATGIITGATGVFVIPAVPYLQALGFERDELVQALGLSFTVSTIALGGALYSHGTLPVADLKSSVLAVIPALAGMASGQALRLRISPSAFRRGFLICMLLLGLEMAFRPLLFL